MEDLVCFLVKGVEEMEKSTLDGGVDGGVVGIRDVNDWESEVGERQMV